MSMLRPSNRSNCCSLTCIHISQEAGKVFLYSHLIKNFPQFVVIYTVKGFGAINKAESEVKMKSLSHVQFFTTPWTAARQASLSFTISQSLLKFISIDSVMPSNHLILCCPLLLLPSIFPSTRVFSSESAFLIRWSKDWSFSLSTCPSNEYSELISFRID